MKSNKCNGCGKIFGEDERGEPTELGMRFTYGSRYDSENWTMHLCDNCIDHLVSAFKFPPKVEGRQKMGDD